MAKRIYHPLLENVRNWPYSISGTLDIVNCGDCEEYSGYPDWAVGSLDTKKHEEPIFIEVVGAVLNESNCDIDSGKIIKVYLSIQEDKFSSFAQDGKMYEEQIYTITKIQDT